MYPIAGHHHISMMSKDAQVINHFYQDVLGMRRVKKTVNQDDPTMYHLFYGDSTGAPGTELTFFEIPMIGRTYRGTNAITRIGLLVPSLASLKYWQERLSTFDIQHSDITQYAGRDAVHFEDPDGLQLVLLNHNSKDIPDEWKSWTGSPVPVDQQILGMGPIEMTVRRPKRLAQTLEDLFGYFKVATTEDGLIYQSVADAAHSEIVIKEQAGDRERPGRGSVHHLAIRAKNADELHYWEEQVKARGFHSTGILDRFYFKSLYFRESNGILFEIATDGPGFMIDSSAETLGEELDLPPFLEDQRKEIEAALKPLT